MSSQTLTYVLLFGPLVIGAIVAFINSEGMNDTTEKVESWTRKTYTNSSSKKNWFSRYIINPVLWAIVQFSNWTDGFTQRGLKNGVRIGVSFYLIILWCVIIYTAIKVIIFLAIAALVIYILFKVLVNSNPELKRGYDMGQRVVGNPGHGKRVNSKTGRIQEEGLLGWKNTDKRIDPETGKLQEEGFIGWKDTGTKVDQETGVIKKEGFWGYESTETRINPETGIIQKRGLLGWENTNERIDPKTGKHQKEGLVGWIDD